MQIIISSKGVKLTTAIEAYIEKKVSAVEKFFAGIIRADVTVGEDSKGHKKGNTFFAECKLEVPGPDVFERETAKDLYSAIDAMRDCLEQELKKRKAKLHKNDKKIRSARRTNKEYHE
jgi:ribosomal subunit interface protein